MAPARVQLAPHRLRAYARAEPPCHVFMHFVMRVIPCVFAIVVPMHAVACLAMACVLRFVALRMFACATMVSCPCRHLIPDLFRSTQ